MAEDTLAHSALGQEGRPCSMGWAQPGTQTLLGAPLWGVGDEAFILEPVCALILGQGTGLQGGYPAGQAGYCLRPLRGPRGLALPLLLVIRGLSVMGIQHVQHEPFAGEDVATLLIYTGILNTRRPQT